MTQDEATGGDATLDDEVVAITAEANELGRATMKWRRLDDASLAALAKRHRAVRARIDAYRDARDDDPDHDALVDADEVLSDVKSCLARARKARRLVTEAAAIDDAGFLDWLEATAREGLPLSSLWERGSTFFGRSKGRAERIFASLAWESVPDPDRIVPLLESAAEQGNADAAHDLVFKQPARRDHWRARALELRHQGLCLEEARSRVTAPRTPERLAGVRKLFGL